MRKVYFVFGVFCLLATGCTSAQHTTDVVKPKYHRAPVTNKWVIDIPVGARHIRFLERKRTKVVKMT
jgi:hypothetical protein